MNQVKSSLQPPQDLISCQQGGDDAPKRRSLLPQPGQTRYSSQQRDTSTSKIDTNTQPAAPAKLRPRSMYQTVTTQTAQSRREDQTANPRSIRPPNATSKPAEPQTTGLSRSRSLRRPGVPTHSAQLATGSTHSRTQSSSSVAGTHRDISNAKIPTERPRSLLIPPSSTIKSNVVPPEPTSVAPRASARLAGMTRSASVKARSELAGSGTSARSGLRPDEPIGAPPRRREIPREDTARTAKPAFTTLQQHFTPRKAGKAPTSTFLQPAPTSGSNSLPPDIISLQSELLQLHLLHEPSAEMSQRWERSARTNLRQKFEEVAALHQAVLEYERLGQEQKNLQALLKWSAETSSVGLIECVQILSGPLHELPSLVEPGGRFQQLVNDFENWMSRVESTWSARAHTTHHGNLASVEGLGDSWKSENAALTRKVTSFARDLGQVRQPSPGSSIASIVEICSALLLGLSDELRVMQVVEADVDLREKDWVEARLQAIAQDVGYQPVDMDMETAAWRM